MNKPQLVAIMAERSGVSRKEVEKVLDAFIGTVADTLKQNKKVLLVGFGVFEMRERKTKIVTIPNSTRTARIPNRRVPAFRPGKDLMEATE